MLVVNLGAGVRVTGAKTETGATSTNIPGYFNESNEITIAITLSGDQADNGAHDMSERHIAVYVGFSTTESITISNSLEDDGLSWTKTFSDNTVTYDASINRAITNDILTNAFGSQPNDR